MEPLYQKMVDCLQCSSEFPTSRVRPSFRKPVKTDSDFCTYYKENHENPDFYVVRICPYCGFAFTENFSRPLSELQRMKFREKVTSTWTMKDYGGKRTLSDAMFAYKLALLTAQIVGEKDRVIAGLLHHIAWLYRYMATKKGNNVF